VRVVGGKFAAAIIAVSILSCLHNGLSVVSLLLFLRKVLRFYLLAIILINSNIDDLSMRKINRLIVWLFVVQIPVAAVKLWFYGQGEQAIGTYAFRSGGNSTIIPLIAVSFLFPYYYLYRKSLYNILLGVGFLAFGVMGGKRGIAILMPLVVLFASWCVRRSLNRRGLSRKTSVIFLTSIVGSMLSVYLVSRLVPRLNPDREVWGTFSVAYSIDRLLERTSMSQDGLVTHRAAATKATVDSLRHRGMPAVLLGLGPGSVMKSIFDQYDTRYVKRVDDLGILYGITAFVWLAFQVGICGTVAWLGFLVYAFVLLSRIVKSETNTYWKAFHVGMMSFSFVALLISSAYNANLIIGDLTSFLYMVLLAFSMRRHALNLNLKRCNSLRTSH